MNAVNRMSYQTYQGVSPPSILPSVMHPAMATPVTPPPTNPDAPPEWVKTLIAKVDSLTDRMSKLDTIEAAVTDMKNDMTSLRVQINEIEKSQQFLSDVFEENRNVSVNQNREINNVKMHLDKVLTQN